MKTKTEIKNKSTAIKHRHNYRQKEQFKINLSKDLLVEQEQQLSACAWCKQLVSQFFTIQNDEADSKILCSEVCFNQYRRAAFKKNKIIKQLKIKEVIPLIPKNTTVSKSITYEIKRDNQRKVLSPQRQSKSSIKKNEVIRRSSPLSWLPRMSKYHRPSFRPNDAITNFSTDFTVSPFAYISPAPINLSYHPNLSAPVQQDPSTLPMRTMHINPFPIATKEYPPNYTWILSSYIQLPISIPLCFPVQSPHAKCSMDLMNVRTCQAGIQNTIDSFLNSQQQGRRLSI
ncbi:unnamed protein product [Rotaria magnacalcarata]|uniref:Uncharacterized protein n=4 Tax=Rotaria magnacalcarata TaxID=392030 RepID=A0A815Y1G5_9BILA|nr:unnamed protein product [Rotaria magnacalcarata]CAF1686568.1 unnamed protein product [Rotaria magnacalcarata]CAF2039283.1 unnamed protein product [Rotaria magnacalcarata]CAF2179821.1 unnamed protein product [Rotaria magnacalcarata]CAF2188984.1 unnamed protein product [Rotaria magnacalcarata]